MRRILHTSRSLALLVGLAMFGGLAVAPAMASTVIFNFGGDVDRVGAQLNPKPLPFTTASTMSGSMTVNTTDGNSNGNRGSYNIESFNLMVGGYTASSGSGQVEIRNVPGGDRFIVTLNNPNPTGPVLSQAPSLFEIQLRGPNSIFSSDHLPGPGGLPPDIHTFSERTDWRLVFGSGGGANPRTVSGGLESLTAVPLPAGVILFGVGLVALIGLGAGGLRNFRSSQA